MALCFTTMSATQVMAEETETSSDGLNLAEKIINSIRETISQIMERVRSMVQSIVPDQASPFGVE